MPKKRNNPVAKAPTQSEDDFVNGAQVASNAKPHKEPKKVVNPYDPNESRTIQVDGRSKPHKTIGLQFNRYEWWELEQAEKITKRSKNSLIREGIEDLLNSLK